MHVMHIALGGCMCAPPVPYGLTGDTGGHIAYILGAAQAQILRPEVARVDIVTRAFSAPGLDGALTRENAEIWPNCVIHRLRTGNSAYLTKADLEAELPALERAFLDLVGSLAPRPTVLHAHFADAARLAQAAARAYGIPWVYTPHSLGLEKEPDGSAALARRVDAERRAMRMAGAIIVSSRDEAERQLEKYGAETAGRTHRINPGVSIAAENGTARARALLAPFLREPDRPLVLAIARPVAKKNLAGLVSAYAGNAELREGANLAIVAGLRRSMAAGEAEAVSVTRDLFDLVDRHDLWGRVALPRRHDAEDARALYALAAEAGVFVNPAFHEPFGLTVIEAARCGVPVVATREGGPSDIIPALGAGYLVDPRDPDAIGAACLAAIRDPLRREKARAARERAETCFDWAKWAARATQVYHGLTRGARRVIEARRILASDVDGTLTGSRPAAARFSGWYRHRSAGTMFVIATGRSISEARRVIAEWALPEPDLAITSVGSEIWRPGARGEMRLCTDYAAHLSSDWRRDDLARVLRRAGVVWQAAYEQRRWKLSLLGDACESARVAEVIGHSGLPARVIGSHGRFIDILPRGAGKASALAFAAARHGLDLEDCLAAGDSGNDADMLERCGAAILPANALPETAGLRGAGLRRSAFAHADGVLDGIATWRARARNTTHA